MFDCLASLGLSVCAGTPYGVFESACSFIFTLLASLGILLFGIRLTAFGLAVVGRLLCLVFCSCV